MLEFIFCSRYHRLAERGSSLVCLTESRPRPIVAIKWRAGAGLGLMVIKKLVSCVKEVASDTGWQSKAIVPKYCPVNKKTKPLGRGWEWRSCELWSGDTKFVLYAECNPMRSCWKSFLIITKTDGASSAVARLECHGSHPGLHVHSNCISKSLPDGGKSLDMEVRLPVAKDHHRRRLEWTRETFWATAKRAFKVVESQPELPL